jgi:S-adenosylmethionine synthetase
MDKSFLFTSESVSRGHPDKIADSVSDAIVDAIFKLPGNVSGNRAAVETMVTTNTTILAGEVSIPQDQTIDYEKIARETIKSIGYDSENGSLDYNFDNTCDIINKIHKQSPEIAVGVDQGGAGDQGMMFGYATNETPSYMPFPITMAHKIMQTIDEARLSKSIPFLRPDGKSQVTIRYDGSKPIAIEKIVIAVPHDPKFANEEVASVIYDRIIFPLVESYKLPYQRTKESYIVNGTGIWTHGGPDSDTGLTGRKIIVDTYGGMGRHGGGAFSGKDPSKVDRSASYAARYVAKNLVAAGVSEKIEVQVAYVIGHVEPVSVMVETFGFGKIPEEKITSIIKKVFDLGPKGIIQKLDLQKPRYKATSAYGHFGREEEVFTWEKLDKVGEIQTLM